MICFKRLNETSNLRLSGADLAVTTLTDNKAHGLFSGCNDQSKIDDIITMLSTVTIGGVGMRGLLWAWRWEWTLVQVLRRVS